jgi:hypothetical protein
VKFLLPLVLLLGLAGCDFWVKYEEIVCSTDSECPTGYHCEGEQIGVAGTCFEGEFDAGDDDDSAS